MSGLAEKDSGLGNLQMLKRFNVFYNEDSSLTSGFYVMEEPEIKKETRDDFFFKEAIVSTRRLDDMVILNGDIDNLPAQFVYKSVESESKAGRAFNSTMFQSYTNKIDYFTLERKLSLLNKQTEKKDVNQIPKVEQSVIESKILESFAQDTTEISTNSVNSTFRVKCQNGETFERSKTTENRNFKPIRKVTGTPKGLEIQRKRKTRRAGNTGNKLTKKPSYGSALGPNELTTDEGNILVVNSDQLLPTCQHTELGTTKAVAGLIVEHDFNSMSSTVSLAENVSLVEEILPTVEVEEKVLSESKRMISNVNITQNDQGQPPKAITDKSNTKKSFSEIKVTTAEPNILLVTTDNKNLIHAPENIDVLLQSNLSTEFSALVKQETHDATEEPETVHLQFTGESSDLISQPETEVSFLLHQPQYPKSAECMTTINQEKNDTESDHFLVTGESAGLTPKSGQILFEKRSEQCSLITEFDATVKPEINDTSSETDCLLQNGESLDPFISPAIEELSSEFGETEYILSKNEEQTSTPTEIITLINGETPDTTSETDHLLVTGESTDLFLNTENLKIATETPETDPLLIKTEVTDLSPSPENVEISIESEQDEILIPVDVIAPIKPERKHLKANKTNNATFSTLVKRNKKESLSNTNAVAKSKSSSGLYTKLSTKIKSMLSSNVQKLEMHIVKKPVDLFEILPLSFFGKNKKAIKKCKPLTITLIDYKVYAKMLKLYEYEVFDDLLHLTKYIQQKSSPHDHNKKENTKTNVSKPKIIRKQTVRDYRNFQSANRIEILDLSLKNIEVYELDSRSNIASFEKNKLPDDFDIEHFKAGIGQKEITRAIVCCWFKRRSLVKLLSTKFGQHTSFTFIKNRHICPFGKCKCCEQCQNENGESPSLPNMVKHDQTPKSLCKAKTLLIPSEPKTLIDKALAYAQNLSFKQRLSVLSDNIISSAQKQIQTLGRPWLNNEIIEMRNLSSGMVEIYDVDSKGEVQTLTKERIIGEESNLLLLGDIIDVSKKSSFYNACCWNKREQLIEKLRNLKVKPESLNFLRKRHTCPVDNCLCCCPYVQVINLKVINNDPLNEMKKRKETSPIADQLEKHMQTIPIPKISKNNEKNTNILKNKDDNLMQSIIDEEISNLIKDSNSSLSTFYKVGLQDEASQVFSKPGTDGLVRPSETEIPVIEIDDDDENKSPANVLPNDSQNIPGPPPLVQFQQPPIVEVNTIITQILNRFQGLRLNIGEKGQVQAVLQNTLDNVSTLELSLLKQILAHAQSLVDKYKITSNANLSSMMGLPGNPQPQPQAGSRIAQSSVAPHNIPMASKSTEVPLRREQSNKPGLTSPVLTQTPVIKSVYSCQTNPTVRPNPVLQDEIFYQPDPISRQIPEKTYAGVRPNPVHGQQSSQPAPRIRTTTKPTIKVTAVVSDQPQTISKPATAPLSNQQSNLPKMTTLALHSSDKLSTIPSIAPKPISGLANLTLANMLSSNTYKKPNFQTNAPMATSSVGKTTKDLETTKKRKKEGLKKSYEMLSRIKPVVFTNPPPLRPISTQKVMKTDAFIANNALNNNPFNSGNSLIPGMLIGNNSETMTHVISNTGAANCNPIPILTNVISLKQNPTANISVGEARTFFEHEPAGPNVETSCLHQNKNETKSLDHNSSSSTDTASDSQKTDDECDTVWYMKPQSSTLFEDSRDKTEASSSKHKIPDENETQLVKKRKLLQESPLNFPMPITEIKEEEEDDIIFFY